MRYWNVFYRLNYTDLFVCLLQVDPICTDRSCTVIISKCTIWYNFSKWWLWVNCVMVPWILAFICDSVKQDSTNAFSDLKCQILLNVSNRLTYVTVFDRDQKCGYLCCGFIAYHVYSWKVRRAFALLELLYLTLTTPSALCWKFMVKSLWYTLIKIVGDTESSTTVHVIHWNIRQRTPHVQNQTTWGK